MKLSLLTALLLLTAPFARADVDPAPKTPASVVEKPEGAAPVAADAEEGAPRPPNEKPWGLTFKQKGMFGNQDYRMSDTYVDLEMPYGLDLNADLNVFSNSTSSTTPTVTFGGGWTSGMVAYTGTYALTTLATTTRPPLWTSASASGRTPRISAPFSRSTAARRTTGTSSTFRA